MISSKKVIQLALVLIGLIAVVIRSMTQFDPQSFEDLLRTLSQQVPSATGGQLSTAYVPAESEAYILSHSTELGLDVKPPSLVPTCNFWTDSGSTPYHKDLLKYSEDLAAYFQKVEEFQTDITDLRLPLRHNPDDQENLCKKVDLHEDGLPGLFPSGQLSLTKAGWTEPLLPQMRHPDFCLKDPSQGLMKMDYLVHDWGVMCRNLKPWSRTVFVDMGASLSFHGGQKSPVLFLLDFFRKFGFVFDHMYAYELTRQDPNSVLQQIPEDLLAAHHWINVGVDADPNSKANPWKLLKENFNEDDLIIVKLDIDASVLERKLVDQLVGDPELMKIVDHFYFEHHVNQQELARHWGGTVESVHESLATFRQLRDGGVASHFWV